ncbi:hypothetical protein AK812_SmicGene8518 [Symbiodinium microadriaticum]|uniref:Uncharacterized protein n=1 Tax=Symbiodinium microadriaticum TaxID=2951 RepID=A0A1Q9EKU8_SYMMI|nr:hypothetical protein AK812_SmicGene8518 [Symbiodinium microadriaticum]
MEFRAVRQTSVALRQGVGTKESGGWLIGPEGDAKSEMRGFGAFSQAAFLRDLDRHLSPAALEVDGLRLPTPAWENGRAQQATEAVADNSAAAKHQAADGFAYFDSFLATSRSRSLPALPKTCGLQGARSSAEPTHEGITLPENTLQEREQESEGISSVLWSFLWGSTQERVSQQRSCCEDAQAPVREGRGAQTREAARGVPAAALLRADELATLRVVDVVFVSEWRPTAALKVPGSKTRGMALSLPGLASAARRGFPTARLNFSQRQMKSLIKRLSMLVSDSFGASGVLSSALLRCGLAWK